MNGVDEIYLLLNNAKQEISALKLDPRFAEEYKAAEANRIMMAAKESARQLGQAIAQQASARLQKADDDYKLERTKYHRGNDWLRTAGAKDYASALAFRKLDDIRLEIQVAGEAADTELLRAFEMYLLPAMANRLTQQQDPLYHRAGDVAALRKQIQGYLQTAMPESYRAASNEREAAVQALIQLERDFNRINSDFRYDDRGIPTKPVFGNGYFDDGNVSLVVKASEPV